MLLFDREERGRSCLTEPMPVPVVSSVSHTRARDRVNEGASRVIDGLVSLSILSFAGSTCRELDD